MAFQKMVLQPTCRLYQSVFPMGLWASFHQLQAMQREDPVVLDCCARHRNQVGDVQSLAFHPGGQLLALGLAGGRVHYTRLHGLRMRLEAVLPADAEVLQEPDVEYGAVHVPAGTGRAPARPGQVSVFGLSFPRCQALESGPCCAYSLREQYSPNTPNTKHPQYSRNPNC